MKTNKALRTEVLCLRRQHGLTLVELMISITLGMLVVLAATALLISSKSSYTSLDQGAIVSDTGRFAIENISRSLRQAAFENWDTESSGGHIPQAPITSTLTMTANLSGIDNRILSASTAAGGSPLSASGSNNPVNKSDVLAVRYFGVGQVGGAAHKDGFGSIVDCLGFSVPAPASADEAEDDRGWSIYYVAESNGEPELRCKYRTQAGGWASEALARGVESFQVLYGVDTDADRIPNQYMTATQVSVLDAGLDVAEKNSKTAWKKVVAVKVALLVRGEQNVSGDTSEMVFDLFGKAYSTANAGNDAGTQISVANLNAAVQKRARHIFQTTVQYRNALEGGL